MQTGGIQGLELVFLLLLLFVVAFGSLARKLQLPYPIVLVLAGTLLGFVPGKARRPVHSMLSLIFLLAVFFWRS